VNNLNDKLAIENEEVLGKYTQDEIFDIPSCLKKALKQKDLIHKIAKNIVNRKIKHIYLIGVPP